MGMFDCVAVECPVEGVAHPETVEWQTKAFEDPFLERYRITSEGRLLHERVHYEDRGDKSAPSGSLARVIGIYTPIHDGWDEVDYDGDMDLIGEIDGAFIQLVARFTNGQLSRIAVLDEQDAARAAPPPEGPT